MSDDPQPLPKPPAFIGSRSAFLILAGFIVVGVGYTLWRLSESPERYYAKAMSLEVSDPQRAETLAAIAVDATGNDYPDAQLFQVRMLLKLKRYDEALGAFSLIQPTADLPGDQIYELAEEAVTHQFPTLAIHALKRAAVQSRESREALGRLLRLNRQLGLGNEAWLTSQQLLELDPENAEAWLITGVFQYQQKLLGAAETALRSAIQCAGEIRLKQEAELALVDVLIDEGKLDEASLQIQKLESHTDHSHPLSMKRVKLLQRQGLTEQALEQLLAIQDVSQAELGTYLHLRGLILFDLKRNAESILCFEELLKRQPWDYQSHNVLAMAYRRTGEAGKADQHQEQADYFRTKNRELLEAVNQLRTDPDNVDLREQLISLYQLLGRQREAAVLMTK